MREHDYGKAHQPKHTIDICIVGYKCPNYPNTMDLGDGYCVDCYLTGRKPHPIKRPTRTKTITAVKQINQSQTEYLKHKKKQYNKAMRERKNKQ